MQIIIIAKWMKETLASITPSEKNTLFNNTINWLESQKQAGKCTAIYSDIFGEHIFTFWNISLEEGVKISLTCPAYNYASVTYFPLIEGELLSQQLKSLS